MFSHTLAQERKEVSWPFFFNSSRPQRNRRGGGWRRLHVPLMRVSMLRWRDRGCGYRCRFWALSLSPLWSFWPQILPHTVVLLSQKRDISPNLNYFPVTGVRNLTKEIIAKQKEASNAAPIPITAPPSPTPHMEGISYAGINVWTDGVREGEAVMGIGAAFDASFCFAIISLVKFLTPVTGK